MTPALSTRVGRVSTRRGGELPSEVIGGALGGRGTGTFRSWRGWRGGAMLRSMPNSDDALSVDEEALVADPDEEDLDKQCSAAIAADRVPLSWVPGPDCELPGSVEVGDVTYLIRVFAPLEIEDMHGLWGQYRGDSGQRSIWVRDELEPRDARDTVLHEVLHAVDRHANAEAGEDVVNRFAPVLLDVLRCNPDLVRFLLSEP